MIPAASSRYDIDDVDLSPLEHKLTELTNIEIKLSIILQYNEVRLKSSNLVDYAGLFNLVFDTVYLDCPVNYIFSTHSILVTCNIYYSSSTGIHIAPLSTAAYDLESDKWSFHKRAHRSSTA